MKLWEGTVIETRKIHLKIESDNGHVIYMARKLAAKAGFKTTDEFLIATVASELSTNILRYAQTGDIYMRIIYDESKRKTGIEIAAIDHGPGIHDIERAMEEKYSTTKNSLGCGLPSVKRIMDQFSIESTIGFGTEVITRKWRNDKHD